MKTWNIISAIISILLGCTIFYESSTLLRFATAFGGGGITLYMGIFASILLIASAIVVLVNLNKKSSNTNLVVGILCTIAFLLCYMGPAIHKNLFLYAAWPLTLAISSFVFYKLNKRTGGINIVIDTSSKKCPYCNAQIPREAQFCGSCGKEYPTDKSCSNCGGIINDGDAYCENCGMNLADGTLPQLGNSFNFDHKELLSKLKKLVPFVVGLILLAAIIWGSFYGYEEYSAYRAKKEAREKFVADSLAKARRDSIKLAEQMEKERIKEERLAKFREKFTFSNIISLLKQPQKTVVAEKCGLSFIYKDKKREEGYNEGDFFELINIVYGYDVEKGGKNESLGYELKAISEHACYFSYIESSDIGIAFYFKNKSDADYLLEIAEDYGLVMYDGDFYIPKKVTYKGVIKRYDEYNPYEDALFGMSRLNHEDGWYMVYFNQI